MPASEPLLLVLLSKPQVRTKKLLAEVYRCVGVANCPVTQTPFTFPFFKNFFGTAGPTVQTTFLHLEFLVLFVGDPVMFGLL